MIAGIEQDMWSIEALEERCPELAEQAVWNARAELDAERWDAMDTQPDYPLRAQFDAMVAPLGLSWAGFRPVRDFYANRVAIALAREWAGGHEIELWDGDGARLLVSAGVYQGAALDALATNAASLYLTIASGHPVVRAWIGVSARRFDDDRELLTPDETERLVNHVRAALLRAEAIAGENEVSRDEVRRWLGLIGRQFVVEDGGLVAEVDP